MEKTFNLDQREVNSFQQFDQARTQALAMIGALTLDMEQARKNLDSAAEQQRAFIRQALASRNVDRYENARAANGQLIVTLPDSSDAPTPPVEIGGGRKEQRTNGPIVTDN
jgi:multidrug resistance efflux pump